MSRNATLASALLLLKGEIGYSTTGSVNTAQDTELYTLIDTKQQWLASKYDWPFLERRADVSIVADTAGRYATFPTTVDLERLRSVEVLYNDRWQEVEYGIGASEYNAYSSGDGSVTAVLQDPIGRWSMYSTTQFEIWPLGSDAQTIRFTGQAPLTTLFSASVYSGAATLDLDNILVVLFAAAEKLARMKKADATAKFAMAEDRLAVLRANYPTRARSVVMGGAQSRRPVRYISIATSA